MVKGEKWLNSKQGNPEVNISGAWVSPEWGVGKFEQNEREITGTLGDYPVKGVVSGSNIYLLMFWGDKVDYSAELKALDSNTFQGSYCQYDIIDELKKRLKEKDPAFIKPINLKRIPTSQ